MKLLAGLTRLESLSLHHCPITDAAAEHLADAPALDHITLDGCREITDHGVTALAAAPKLTSVSLVGCWKVTDRGLAALTAMPKLTYVGLCRSGGFAVRVLRKFGVAGNAEVGSFSARGVERLTAAHPGCDVWQPIDWDALSG